MLFCCLAEKTKSNIDAIGPAVDLNSRIKDYSIITNSSIEYYNYKLSKY